MTIGKCWALHNERQLWPCLEGEINLSVYDRAPERAWRHLDTYPFRRFLHARIPWPERSTHGVKQVRVSWAEERSR